MRTTKPFLVLDLEKSWREDVHPRDKHGKFSTVKGGSRIVTKAGKTGVVQSVSDSHYNIRTDDGKLSKVKKDNVLHEKDHKRVVEAEKKAKRRSASAKKGAKQGVATKAQKKANGTAPATKLAEPKGKVTAKPKTAKKVQNDRVKAMTQKASTERKANLASKKKRDMEAPVMMRAKDQASEPKPMHIIVPKNTSTARKQDNAQTNTKIAEYDNLENTLQPGNLDEMWGDPKVGALMKKPMEKRSAEDIRQLAGEMTNANDKLARKVVLKMGEARGYNLASQVNRIGNSATPSSRVKVQETNLYGDLLQSARSAMFETIHNVLAGSQNPSEGTAIGQHVIRRMKDAVHKDIYTLMNSIPAPERIRQAMGDMNRGQSDLSQKLGRTPSEAELGEHLMKTSESFKNSPINELPYWDDKSNEWVAPRTEVKDPKRRLELLKHYAQQQRTVSGDSHIGDASEREISINSNAVDSARSPQEIVERKERQKELEGKLPTAMRDMGMTDASITAFQAMYSQPSETGSKPQMTLDETANFINANGGWNGKPISGKWVDKHVREGRKVIAEALASNHPAIQQLAMLKSFVFNMILRGMYEFDLVKSIHAWGLDTSVMRESYVGTRTESNVFELRKSLTPTEYVGSYVTTDEGYVQARIVELRVQGDDELRKSFVAFGDELKKSIFPHKGKSNANVNQKATDYIKANKSKYAGASKTQHQRAKEKKGALTWSEELLIKNPGSAWVSWGGKRILVNSDTGEIVYDSKNDAHREDHNNNAPEDKLDFHHEKEDKEELTAGKEKGAREEWEKGAKDLQGNSMNRWLNKNNAKVDEEGNLTFDHGDLSHELDHGIQAFKEEQEKLQESWKPQKAEMAQRHKHKTVGVYGKLSDEEKEAYEGMGEDERVKHIGKHIASQEGVNDVLQTAHDKLAGGASAEDVWNEHEADFKALGKQHGSMALQNKKYMNRFMNNHLKGSDMNEDAIHEGLGKYEFQRAGEEANKRMLDEGAYHIGNPKTGKSYIVKVAHKIDPQTGNFTTDVTEVFDPESRQHMSIQGWGQLGRALGLGGNIQEDVVQNGNKDANSPMVKQVDDEEYQNLRKNTKYGLQDAMTHKDFRLVDQQRDADGKVKSQTFAMDMPDGTQNAIEVGADGYIKDPIMARLIKQDKRIHSAEDLHDVLKGAVGNRAWVTAHAGSDVHIGDAVGHHIQLEYDGKGAPRVVGGKYDGYRFMDSKDVPKGAVDASTGDPIKTLFKNGKLIERKHTDKNKVEMKEGNAVMFQDGDKWRKGEIMASEGDKHQIKDSEGNLIGWRKGSELEHAKEKGRTLSRSGNAVVKVGKTGLHSMNTNELFRSEDPKQQKQLNKAKGLFEEALRKAKVNKAFDDEGNLKKELALSDAQHRSLNKVLGRSKAGKSLMKQFNSEFQSNLEIHVPEHLKAVVEAEGVRVGANGVAKISAGKFEQLRDVLNNEGSGLSLDHQAKDYMVDHFKRKDRTPKPMEQIKKEYQASQMKGEMGDRYRSKFKEGSFLLDPNEGLYGTQLEGTMHLVERGNAIAGHGMGTGKTILGITSALYHKSKMEMVGKKAGKTLVVAPKGIMSDWGKEIGTHTNSKALYIGSNLTKKDADGKRMKHENGRNMWGQGGTEHESTDFKSFKKNADTHASEDHDFHVVSYDTFMKNRDHFANSGMYDNITIDEVHAFKNKGGERGKALSMVTSKFKNVWGLSGTPMENDAREIHSLIDTITGGKHELGSRTEFQNKFMMKDGKGKITGVKPEMAGELGDILANIVQFRGGEDVTYNDGSKIHFPQLVGESGTPDNPNPQQDFIGNMSDRSRDHGTNASYGTKHSVTDYEVGKEIQGAEGTGKTSHTYMPKNVDPKSAMGKMYETYNSLQQKYLPDSKLAELASASTTGYETQSKGTSNYLTGMQKLQKFLNTPLAHKMHVPGGGNAIESSATDIQAEKAGKGKKNAEPIPHEVDSNGFKRYYESDGKGSYVKNADGSPKLLPPLHHNNPKAQYLKDRVSTYLTHLQKENADRAKAGKPELMPKMVVKSSYTTFGTDIVHNVLKELENEHPELIRWKAKHGEGFGVGQFTGEATDREQTKVGFRGNKKDYANDQGNLWATTVSPAGKEGVDFGNAHMMIHYDQEYNPQKMAQFTARVRRSDSAKSHAQVDRANAVRVESLHMPGTVEDFMFNMQDAKMQDIEKVTGSTKEKEKAPKYGETSSSTGSSFRGFTRGQKNKVGAKPNKAQPTTVKRTKTDGGVQAPKPLKAVASASKAMRLVVLG